jgi:hypothetical protein
MWLWILLVVVALAIGLFAWGLLHLRHSVRAAEQAIAAVTLDRIDALRRECEQVFRDRFGDTLVLEDLEATARLLGARLDDHEQLKAAFAKDELYWHFVLPVGAYVGELMRVHAGGTWKASTEGGLEMTIPAGEGEATTFPFDKVLKHCTVGDRGDMVAYLLMAPRMGEMVRDMAAGGPAAASGG